MVCFVLWRVIKISAKDQRDFLFEQRGEIIKAENNKDEVLAQHQISLEDFKQKIRDARELIADTERKIVEIQKRSEVFEAKNQSKGNINTPLLHQKFIPEASIEISNEEWQNINNEMRGLVLSSEIPDIEMLGTYNYSAYDENGNCKDCATELPIAEWLIGGGIKKTGQWILRIIKQNGVWGIKNIEKVPLSISSLFYKMGSFKNKSFNEADKILKNNKFEFKGITPGGYKKYFHNNGAKVQIRPNGQMYRYSGNNRNVIRYNDKGNVTQSHGQEFLKQ